ncbi:MAG TPA: carboxypeptidase-like regulatory domain-containing protein [Candidatus Acidoferrum sp.]
MTQGRLRILGALFLTALCSSVGVDISRAQAKSVSGKIAGVVNDSFGTPQLGATVEMVSEATGVAAARDFLTNTQGIFRGERLAPGFYTVRVTLAGYLPTLEQHVRITSHLTTVVRIQLESMFASLDQLRHQPASSAVEADDWKWVLRSASVARPVLQWMDDGSLSAANSGFDAIAKRPRARLEFTDGARHPGSGSNLPATPATAFAYDQKLGTSNRLLLAGEMNYDSDAPGGGFATVWLPTGSLGNGPHSALVLREAKLGPEGPTFRGVRIEQGGAFTVGDRNTLHYGGEYVMVGLGSSAVSVRPHLQLDTQISNDWHTALVFAAQPDAALFGSSDLDTGAALAAALDALDAFPTLLLRDGHPVLQNGWHEELAVERKLGTRGKIQAAAFHDDNRHVAVFGRGTNLPSSDYLQDYFSNGFAYDAGSSGSWGTRIALKEKLNDNVEVTAVYAFAGVLTASDFVEGPLRDLLRTAMRNSMAANVSAKVPHLGTKINVGYKWVDGVTISRLDNYGESLFQTDPYLHLAIRQTLPKFGPGRWEAIADCDNLLAQGYVPLSSQDGRVVAVPAFRTFRGGLSLQF